MKKFRSHQTYLVVGTLLVLGIIFAYLGFAKPPFPRVYFAETDVLCLPDNGEHVEIEWHMHLSIFVDDVAEGVPANIGNTMKCTTELHTHQSGGTVSIELDDVDRTQELSFADFFSVWGVPVQREGYTLAIFSDGVQVVSLKDIRLHDDGEVVLRYSSVK